MTTNSNETREQMLDRLWSEEDAKRLPSRFPLVAANRRSGADRRVNVEHALSQPMPTRARAPNHDPQAIEASVAAIMRLARECAHKHAREANWLGLEAAIRKAIAPTFF